jgi:TolB-like protein
MKKLIILALAVLIAGSAALAQTTAPSPAVARVLVVPFKLVGDTDSHTWISGALQESLLDTVSGDTAVQALGLTQPMSNSESAGALSAAKDAGASLVIFGSYQFSDNQMRVTGQAVNVADGRTLTTLTATGPVLDLFKIEDSLTSQLRTVLPQAPSNMPIVTYGPDQSTTPPADVTVAQPQPQPADVYAAAPAPAVPYYASDPYATYAPDYAYGYPTYGYPIYIYGGFGYGHVHYFPHRGFGGHIGYGGGFGGGHMGHR